MSLVWPMARNGRQRSPAGPGTVDGWRAELPPHLRFAGCTNLRVLPLVVDTGLYGCTSDVERVPSHQPHQHSHQGLSRDRILSDHRLQPTPRRMPDAHPPETLVSDV